MQLDRRRKRSNYTALSLHYWLSAVADRTSAFAFVLADPAGLLIASSIRGPEAEEIAAVAPLMARNQVNGNGMVGVHGVPMAVQEVSVDGMPMLLCAIGDRDLCEPAIDQARDGVSRILTN